MTEQPTNRPNIVDPQMVGDVWSNALPVEDPVLYGHVDISPKDPVEARSLQTFTLTYTIGRHGIDDTGAIAVVFRGLGDWGRLQVDDPTALNYATAIASNGAGLTVQYDSRGFTRPWFKALRIRVTKGFLREGDQITIVLGDRSGGSPGLLTQTFCESGFEFKVLADVCATGHFVQVADSPAISIIPGPVAQWRCVTATLRRPGEIFHLGIKAEDRWGNPTPQAQGRLLIKTSRPVNGLPETLDYPLGERAVTIENLSVGEPGEVHIHIEDEAGNELARAAPLLIRAGTCAGYWADLHGQSGESIGIGTSLEYFNFARDCAFLDATSHQANDFQVNNVFWNHINKLTTDFHHDHRFVCFPGYEWSGNTAVGGDRNVFYHREGEQIHRSSHALLPDRSDIDTDAEDSAKLFEKLTGKDVFVFAHVGGRYADIDFAHDGRLEKSMEVHSAWGTFEWLIEDCFRHGYRVGLVCNSDGHKGRPGASYPGASMFGAYGGLTCFFAEELTRAGLIDAIEKRHHYGTTGNRLHMDVTIAFDTKAQLYDRDPAVYDDAVAREVSEVMMGDIAQTDDETVTLRLRVAAATAIERIEIRNGTQVLQTLRGYTEDDLGARVRLIWSGAEYRGRGRETRWQGDIQFDGASIESFEKINMWNHERPVEQEGTDRITFDAITTGNFGGVDMRLRENAGARVRVKTNLGEGDFALADIGFEDQVIDAGGLKRQLRLFRLPEVNSHKDLSFEVPVNLNSQGDNPIWICVTTEDGFQAWSSPIYLFR